MYHLTGQIYFLMLVFKKKKQSIEFQVKTLDGVMHQNIHHVKQLIFLIILISILVHLK